MNNHDDLISVISNHSILTESPFVPFIDEEFAKVVTEINVNLRNDARINLIPSSKADNLLRKTSEYVSLMGTSFLKHEEDIRFDDIIEDSIVITFKKRKDMVLNIYTNDDIEETYLSYSTSEDDMLVYNTLPVMVELVKKLLNHEM